jgi:hypothetical protein
MKPHPITDCLLRYLEAAAIVSGAMHLALRNRGPMLRTEYLAEATQWQRHRLFWLDTYRRQMRELLGRLARGQCACPFSLYLPI